MVSFLCPAVLGRSAIVAVAARPSAARGGEGSGAGRPDAQAGFSRRAAAAGCGAGRPAVPRQTPVGRGADGERGAAARSADTGTCPAPWRRWPRIAAGRSKPGARRTPRSRNRSGRRRRSVSEAEFVPVDPSASTLRRRGDAYRESEARPASCRQRFEPAKEWPRLARTAGIPCQSSRSVGLYCSNPAHIGLH